MPKRKGKGKAPPVKVHRPKPADHLSRFRFWLLLFFLFSMPFFFLPTTSEYGYIKTIYTLVFVSFLLVLWGIEGLLRKEMRIELSWLFPVLPALVLAALLSLTGKTPAGVVLQSATLILYFGLIFLLVANAGTGDRELVLILGALLLSAVAQAFMGLLQYLRLIPGGPTPGLDVMISTMGNRQFLAGFLSYLVLTAGILLVRVRRTWLWIPSLLGAGFVLAVVLLTQQVGVRLGLGAGLAFVAFGVGFWSVRAGSWPRWAAVAGLGLAALGAVLGPVGLAAGGALALAGGALWAVGKSLRRFPILWALVGALVLATVFLLLPPTTPLQGVVRLWERQSGAVRAWDWWVGYIMWQDRPLAGIGLGGYKIYFVPYKPLFLASPAGKGYAFPFPRADQAHNEYVQIAAELGAVGVSVVVAGFGLLVWLGFRRLSAQKEPAKRLELLLLGGGLIAVFVHAVPTFPWHLPASSLAFVALLSLACSPRYGPVGNWAVRLRGRGLKALVAGLSLMGLAVSVIAVRDAIGDALYLSGQVALTRGDVKEARAKLSQAVALDFCPRISLYWLGVAHARAGDYPAAKKALRLCLTRYVPETLYLNLAGVHLQLGELAEAKELLNQLLATLPLREMDLEARYLLAAIDLQGGDYPEAKRRCEELVVVEPRFERAWILLGEIARMRYQWSEARTQFTRALAIIAEKETRIRQELQGTLPLVRYGELQVELERLGKQRDVVERALRELP